MLSPTHSAAALADELAISAMTRTLRALSFDDLADMSCRAHVYLDAKIHLNDMYRFDSTALRVECIRRKALGELAPARIAETA